MGNQLAVPRSYKRYVDHATLTRTRHSNQFAKFLTVQVARLAGVPGATAVAKKAALFAKLKKNSVARVLKATTYASLR
jgi:hypothetical protein